MSISLDRTEVFYFAANITVRVGDFSNEMKYFIGKSTILTKSVTERYRSVFQCGVRGPDIRIRIIQNNFYLLYRCEGQVEKL